MGCGLEKADYVLKSGKKHTLLRGRTRWVIEFYYYKELAIRTEHQI